MTPATMVAALQRRAELPGVADAVRAAVDELVELIEARHDAAELLDLAIADGLSLRECITLFRRPRLVK